MQKQENILLQRCPHKPLAAVRAHIERRLTFKDIRTLAGVDQAN